MILRRWAGAFALLAVSALFAAPASAKTTTYHYFSHQVYSQGYDANGRPLSQNAQPSLGAVFSSGSDDYVGNHTHHARTATASDHIVCTITSNPMIGRCYGQIAIGGAMIFGDNFTLNFGSPDATVIKITGGTGRFRRARGTITAQSVGNDTDLTVTVR